MRDSHHDHLINLRDGKVIEFTNEEIEKLQAEIARKLGYKLVVHRLRLYCVPLDDDKSGRVSSFRDGARGTDPMCAIAHRGISGSRGRSGACACDAACADPCA